MAGGQSVRMQYPKLFLNFDGRCFAEKITEEYLAIGIRPVIVVNQTCLSREWNYYLNRIKSGAHLIYNKRPDLGRIHSLQLGVRALGNVDYCFIQNIDNPFVNTSLLRRLIRERNTDGVTVPVYHNKGGHPILVNREIMDAVLGPTRRDETLRDILAGFRRVEVNVLRDTVLVNMNTMAVYYKEMLKYGVLQYLH